MMHSATVTGFKDGVIMVTGESGTDIEPQTAPIHENGIIWQEGFSIDIYRKD